MEKKSTINAFRFVKPLVNVVLEDSSAHHLLTFLCLAANSNTGLSWHSQASIKSHTGIDPRTVRKATRTLEKLGLITCESQGQKINLQYTVNHAKLVELAEAGKALCAERRKSKQASDSDRTHMSHALGHTCPTASAQNCPTALGQSCPTNRVIEPTNTTT
jgi:DNA-binding MarR family transcriptional regulator